MDGPFTREQALRAGLPSRALLGRRFVRLFPRVWVWNEHAMTHGDWILAASLALPERAQMTGITRIQELGLREGPLRPFHFVVRGDLHIDLPDVFLHRTEMLPPLDDTGVTPAGAFLAYASDARVIDAIKVGDWLLNQRHMTLIELRELVAREPWRAGAREARWISGHLDAGARSLKESETRAVLVFAGLPEPEVNRDVRDADGTLLGCGDLVYLPWRLLVEYEGRQHLQSLEQWNRDIDRYAGLRMDHWRYVQVTTEKLARPKSVVAEVYEALVQGGFNGPAPTFGRRWNSLFEPVSRVLPRRAVG